MVVGDPVVLDEGRKALESPQDLQLPEARSHAGRARLVVAVGSRISAGLARIVEVGSG